ncbi:MarR family transcriptional regulator [Paludibacter sp.]|uniref:MarR family winged helix-turn-helix transcriptional regulator n=1 Tax=Paludibacter sp. TaxID=1898105 RepID=UPI0013542D0A|nr:MarR family transcriptional regulator [Paludibacter sp.]MTK54091.1 MarR family transcriptional regulator [Paludibacter sp.]
MEAVVEYETVLNILSGRVGDKIKRPFYKAFARECIAISSEQYAILACLVKQNMVTQQTLCGLTKKDKPNVTRLLDRLENKSLVQRIADAEDKRKKRICITEQGMLVYEKVNHIVSDMVSHAMKNIDEGQLVVFQDVLRHMMHNLSMVV